MFVCGDDSGAQLGPQKLAAGISARSMPPGTRSRGRPRSHSPADDAAAQRRRADGGEREDEDESEDEDVVQPATTIAGERAAGHGGSGVAATA
jgi:hypothetical protein